jgi:hypothetical protein
VPSRSSPVSLERIARHGFVDRADRDVAGAARRTTAIQAQDPQASRFGLRSRSGEITEAAVFDAIADRTVVRTWLMRATIHLVSADDVRWLTAALGSSIARRFRKRWLDMGLTPDVLRRTADALPGVLAGRPPRTKKDIVADLAARGVTFPDADPQAAIHVLLHATAEGLVCRGPERGRDATFTLLDEWLPNAPDGPRGDEALAELARRYFTAFAPATAADFATWSGLPSSRAVGLIRDELETVDVGGRPGYRPRDGFPTDEGSGCVRLLAGYDNYLVGYRDRSLLLAEEKRPDVYVGGIIKPVVTIDGRVVAIWQVRRRSASTLAVAVTPLEPLSRRTVTAIEQEVSDIGRFTERSAELVLEPEACRR